MFSLVVLTLAIAQFATAHFKIDYPEWRGDTLNNESYSQWTYPCGGVPTDMGKRTDWPIGGGSVALELHHPWAYVFINIGLGSNVSNFNYTLTPRLMNVTGKGSFCLPVVSLADAGLTVKDGDFATIQVATSGESGSALYNCADITFRSSAKTLSGDACTNSSGVTAAIVGQATNSSTSTNTSTRTGHSAAPGTGVNFVALTSVVGLRLLVVFGI